jgi:hypothetical protein
MFIKKLLAPVFFFHRGKFKSWRIEADYFQVNAAVGTNDDLALNNIIEGNFGITFRAVGN